MAMQNDMKATVSLDAKQALQEFHTLTDQIRTNSSAWKSNEAAAKSNGDYMKANKEKVEGLSKALTLQKEKLENLKSQQQQQIDANKKGAKAYDNLTKEITETQKALDKLKNDKSGKDFTEQIKAQEKSLKELTKQQTKLEKENAKGDRAYAKLTDSINKNKKSLTTLTGQYQQAKSKSSYYSSGLADLEKGYRSTMRVAESYVERLKAEGKTEEANRKKLEEYGTSIKILNRTLSKQEAYLKQVERANGANSEAYHKQEIKVNATATSLGKLKNEQDSLNRSMKAANPSFLDKMKSKLTGVDKEATHAHTSIADIAKGSFIGNALSNAFGHITSAIGGAISSAKEYSLQQETMNATWLTLTGNAKKGQAMVKQIDDMAASAQNSTEMVEKLSEKFYAINGNAKQTGQLTKSILTLQDAFGQTDDAVENFGTQFSQMMANGKVSSQDMMSFVNVFPKLRVELLKTEQKQTHNKDLTMKQMNDLMSQGKISSKTMEDVVNHTADVYSSATKNFGNTIPGMERTIKSTMPRLLSAISDPFTKASNPIIGTLSKWISSSKTEKEVSNIGKTFATGLNKTIAAFSGKSNDGAGATKALDSALKGLNSTLKSVFGFISKNAQPIKSIGSSVWSIVKAIGEGAWSVFSGSIKAIAGVVNQVSGKKGSDSGLNGIASALKSIAKNKTVFKVLGGAMTTYFAAGKVSKITGRFKDLGVAISKVFVKRDADGNITGLTKLGSAAKDAGSTIKKAFTQTAWPAVKKLGGSLVSLGKSAGGAVLTAVKTLGSGIGSLAKTLGGAALSAVKKFGSAFATMGKFMLTNPIGLTITAIVALGTAFVLLYKNCKPFRNFINNIGKEIKKAFAAVPGIIKNVQKWFGNLGKSIQKTFKSITKNVSKAWKSITSGFSSFGKSFKKKWNALWNTVSKFLNKAIKTITKTAKKGWKNVKNGFSSFGKAFKKIWDSFWNTIHKFFSKIFDKISDTFSKWGKNIKSGLSSFGKGFKSAWQGLWNGVSKIFSTVWKGIKKLAQNAMNGLIDIVNGGIKAVDSVIHAFGGKEHTIKLLSHIKLASGTASLFKGLASPIEKPILATLNDGFDSPETGNKEMLVHADGSAGIIEGRNTQAMLMPGDNVINARETAMLMAMQGSPHFAKGTTNLFASIGQSVGNAASGAWNWIKGVGSNLKKYFNLATKIVAHPIKYVESLYKWSDSKNIGGAMVDLAKGGFTKTKDNVKSWWSSLWHMASDNLDGGGSSSALLKAVEKYGKGHQYHLGSKGPDLFDCSGLVEYALKKSFGIALSAPSGSQYANTQHISKAQAHSGDLVFWGSGGSEHVGVYAGGNKYFSAESPSAGIRMNTLDSVVGKGKPLFGRVRGLKQDSESDTPKGNSALDKQVKSQVGSGFFKFISKLGSLFGEPANPSGDGVGRWKPYVKKALAANGLSTSSAMINRVLRQISTESHGDPKIIQPGKDPDGDGSGPAKGLMQVKQGTFDAWSKPGHKNILNGYDNLLAGLAYAKHTYGPSLSYLGNGHGYANGGLSLTEKLAHISEGNRPEMIIPLGADKHSRALELLNETTRIVKGNDDAEEDTKTNQLLSTIIAILSSLAGSDKLDTITGLIRALIAQPTEHTTKVDLDGKTLATQLEKYQTRKSVRRRNGYAF